VCELDFSDFHPSGTYEVHGSYYLEFNDPDTKSWRTIWEDNVSADFRVGIKEAAREAINDRCK